MNSFTYVVVTAERERDVRHTTGNHCMWKFAFDICNGVDEIESIVVVFINTSSNGKDVRVENNIFRRKTHLVDKNMIGATTDFYLTFTSIRLPYFVKGHNDNGSTIATNQFRLMNKFFFAFF